MSAIDTHWMLFTENPLQGVARKLLKSASLTIKPNRTNESILFNAETEPVHILKEMLCGVEGGEGRGFETVHLQTTLLGGNRIWMNELVERGDALRNLSIHDQVGELQFAYLLRERGKQLFSLHLCFFSDSAGVSPWILRTGGYLESVALFCPNISELELHHVRYNCSALWKALGRTLKSLTVVFDEDRFEPHDALMDIRNHCVQLNSIDVRSHAGVFGRSVSDCVADLYMSYGSQLHHANFEHVDPDSCESIEEACPNVRAVVGYRRRVVDQMLMLGQRVRKLMFENEHSYEHSYNVEQMAEAARRCKALETLVKHDLGAPCLWSLELFKALFDDAKPKLCSIRWPDWNIPENLFSEAMELLSLQASNLRELSITYNLRSRGCFSCVAKRNKFLECVNIGLGSKSFEKCRDVIEGEDIIIDIIETFEKCAKLQELHISYSGECEISSALREKRPRVADACVRFYHRRVYVEIGFVVYVP